MSIEEIKTIIEETGSYTGPIPSVPAMYYHGFSQRKGVWSKKVTRERQIDILRAIVTGPGVYTVDVNPGSAVTFAQQLRQQGHNVSTKRVDGKITIFWNSHEDEFAEIFSKLNLQECLVVKAILDAHVDRLTQE